MRKRILGRKQTARASERGTGWLNLQEIATVEVTSEEPGFPVESVFGWEDQVGWRASQGGEQEIRILFDEPISVRRIELRFDEPTQERTQEFVLRWLAGSGGAGSEIVRQQWNFSPGGSTTEIEQYAVDLDDVSVLELMIRPDLRRHDAVASLTSWRVG